VTEIELEHGVSAGIVWQALAPGMVPVYEEHSARLRAHISLSEWTGMSPMERAVAIALDRVGRAIENQQAEAEIRHMERKSKASNNR
jgi:hypothetical protein